MISDYVIMNQRMHIMDAQLKWCRCFFVLREARYIIIILKIYRS